jgi:hypothetical protein
MTLLFTSHRNCPELRPVEQCCRKPKRFSLLQFRSFDSCLVERFAQASLILFSSRISNGQSAFISGCYIIMHVSQAIFATTIFGLCIIGAQASPYRSDR